MILDEYSLENADYPLDNRLIAQFPLANRAASKLLFYNEGLITHHHFYDLPKLLPPESFLFLNNTKVIPARLLFQKSTGAVIEIFLLKPYEPSEMETALRQEGRVCWECMVGNLKRWPQGTILEYPMTNETHSFILKAEIRDREKLLIDFFWEAPMSFAEVLTVIGEVPLPPYLNRKSESSDKERYQTVYAKLEGAVAAPTAGLHFTEEVLEEIQKKGIQKDYLTLHVGAGTFQGIKTDNILQHAMHDEKIIFSQQNLKNILEQLHKMIVACGTTAMRTLESIYWLGVMAHRKELNPNSSSFLDQNYPNQSGNQPLKPYDAIESLLHWMEINKKEILKASTQIFIYPGYEFKICKGLQTNFHMPKSTLVLLIAAFIGEDWRRVYNEAIKHDYRFLSYGDSSLLIPKTHQ